jgi:type VI secretion system secreted protein Hcp
MGRNLISLVAGSMILATASSAGAANTIFMTLTGQKSGNIKGGVTQKGREGSLQVTAFEDEIISPRDAASGLPTGQRQHKPIKVTLELDQSAPLLYQMLANNENITALELKFWHPSPAGVESQFYSVKLTNASIAEIHASTSADAAHTPMLDVSFTYQKIQWTWTDGGTVTAADNWQSKV